MGQTLPGAPLVQFLYSPPPCCWLIYYKVTFIRACSVQPPLQLTHTAARSGMKGLASPLPWRTSSGSLPVRSITVLPSDTCKAHIPCRVRSQARLQHKLHATHLHACVDHECHSAANKLVHQGSGLRPLQTVLLRHVCASRQQRPLQLLQHRLRRHSVAARLSSSSQCSSARCGDVPE